MVQPLWKTVWRLLKKFKIQLPYDPAILLLGIYPKKNEITISKRYLHSNVHYSIIYNSQDTEAGDFSSDAVVKNPPANAGDTGSSPGLRRSHMPRSY